MRSERGWSLPFMWIAVGTIALLTWWLGWIAIALVPVFVLLITAGVWIHDLTVHDAQCRWCNVIKAELAGEREIDLERFSTKHLKVFPTYMHIQVYVDRVPDVRVDIDFNEHIHRVQAYPYTDRSELGI